MDVVAGSSLSLGSDPEVGLLLERVLGRSNTNDVAIGKLVALLIAKRSQGGQVPGNNVLGLLGRDTNGEMVEHFGGCVKYEERLREVELK